MGLNKNGGRASYTRNEGSLMDATDMWHVNSNKMMDLMKDVHAIEQKLEDEPEEMSVGACGIDWHKVKAHLCDSVRKLEEANAEIWEGIKDDTP